MLLLLGFFLVFIFLVVCLGVFVWVFLVVMVMFRFWVFAYKLRPS